MDVLEREIGRVSIYKRLKTTYADLSILRNIKTEKSGEP